MQRSEIRNARDTAHIQSGPYSAFMSHGGVHEALADAASRYAQRRALTFIVDADPATPPRMWTYTQLLADVRRTARLFRQLAGDEPPRIAMLLPAIPEAYLTLWGGETAGVVCPINYLLDAAHIAELVRAADCNILVALGPNPELDIWSRVGELQRACPRLRHVLAVGGAPGHADFSEAIAAMPADAPAPEKTPDPNRLAALFHTGGTTGAPKLAQHTHANQLHAAWGAAQMYGMREQDVILNGFPLFHVAGAFVYGLSALLSGAEVVLPTLLGLRNPAFARQYWTFVGLHNVTLLAAVPTVIATLLGLEPPPGALRTVRMLLTGGSPLPTELATAFERKFQVPVRNILGMTECAGVISIEPFFAPRVPGSCGLPLPFTEVKAVAPDGRACAAGEGGILRVRGPNVGPGYTDARRDAGTFTDDGWLITGDIGHVDAEGRVFVTGRAKDVIIRGGHNIDPQLIEEALLQHPDVLMAAAVGEPDEYAGELPVAFVSLRPGAAATPQELSAFANERIPERPAYPKRIEVLPAIPMTAIGKVFKPRLRMLACERVLNERLQRAGLQGAVRVHVEDAGGALAARFEPLPGAEAPGRERIADLMRAFAIDWRYEP
jgi:fatty-acyl-CoA synthase